MFTFAVMLAAAAALPTYDLPPAKPAKCSGECASRYRLPSSGDNWPSIKSRALAEDGGQCSVVGAKLCTSTPRRILTAAY